MFIFRNTYGWHRSEFTTSHRKIAEATTLRLAHVGRTLNSLEEKNIIARQPSKTEIIIQFNPNYMTWRLKDPAGLFTEVPQEEPGSSRGDGLEPQEVKSVSSTGTFPVMDKDELSSITKGFWKKVGLK